MSFIFCRWLVGKQHCSQDHEDDLALFSLIYKSLFTENTVATQKHNSASINTNKAKTTTKSVTVVYNWYSTINKISYRIIITQVCTCSASSTRLSTWHCPHVLPSAVLRTRAAAPLLGARRCRSICPACTALSSKPAACRCCGRMMGQIDGRTDRRTLTFILIISSILSPPHSFIPGLQEAQLSPRDRAMRRVN